MQSFKISKVQQTWIIERFGERLYEGGFMTKEARLKRNTLKPWVVTNVFPSFKEKFLDALRDHNNDTIKEVFWR